MLTNSYWARKVRERALHSKRFSTLALLQWTLTLKVIRPLSTIETDKADKLWQTSTTRNIWTRDSVWAQAAGQAAITSPIQANSTESVSSCSITTAHHSAQYCAARSEFPASAVIAAEPALKPTADVCVHTLVVVRAHSFPERTESIRTRNVGATRCGKLHEAWRVMIEHEIIITNRCSDALRSILTKRCTAFIDWMAVAV